MAISLLRGRDEDERRPLADMIEGAVSMVEQLEALRGLAFSEEGLAKATFAATA